MNWRAFVAFGAMCFMVLMYLLTGNTGKPTYCVRGEDLVCFWGSTIFFVIAGIYFFIKWITGKDL